MNFTVQKVTPELCKVTFTLQKVTPKWRKVPLKLQKVTPTLHKVTLKRKRLSPNFLKATHFCAILQLPHFYFMKRHKVRNCDVIKEAISCAL